MPGRGKPLITRNGIPDPQAYNPQTGQWESFIGVSWGKTAGGLYVPIRVDDQGRQEVTLSGNKAELVVLERALRTTNQQTDRIMPPTWAKGFAAHVDVYGITGTFGPDEGVRLYVSNRPKSITRVYLNGYTKWESSTSSHQAIWYPGIISNVELDNHIVRSQGSKLLVGLPLAGSFVFGVYISGTFGQGEGVDCAVRIEWLD